MRGCALIFLLAVAAVSNPAPMDGVRPFIGRWKFANPQSYDLPRVEISLRKDQCIVQIWYVSTRGLYIPWDSATIQFYRVGETREYQGIAKWKVDYGEEIAILRVKGGKLTLEMFTNFNDDRVDSRSVDTYTRSKAKEPWSTERP